ncbi:MAG: ATP-binding protein, partial [Bacteroidia bacterium]
ERKNAEKKLKQSIKELKDYKEALDESCIVAVTNQQGIITHVNDNFCEISKYTRDELIGQNHSIINSGYHPKEFIKNLWATITYGKVWRGEIKNKAKDETYYWVDTTIIPFINKQGKPFQYIAIRADITKRKKAEQELNELNEHLELKVIERTAQLETVNKELESFSYSVSHDLRAPLRAVTGYANMLEEDYQTKIDEEGKRLLSIIKYNAEKMGQLIDDLLSFSRLGRKEMQTTNVDMNGLVEGVLIEIDKVTKHQAEIKVNKLHHIKSDYGLMNQVMINLISNAIKYSSKNKTPTIEVKSKLVGNDLVFSVQDNGAGFDMRYVDKLFGVFQRLHTQDEFEGTGVGLAIVQRIISKHGGRVWAEGKVNKGAAFYFSIPQS